MNAIIPSMKAGRYQVACRGNAATVSSAGSIAAPRAADRDERPTAVAARQIEYMNGSRVAARTTGRGAARRAACGT